MVKHKGKVEQDPTRNRCYKIVWFSPELLNAYLGTICGKHVDVIIKLPHKPRNLPQNARHWARMTFAAQALGDRTPEELHQDFRAYFLTDKTKTPPRIKSSTELTTKEFSEWEEDIDRVLAENNIVVPEPQELDL